MTPTTGKACDSIGFLTVCQRDGVGLLGGYLVLNPAGRPLEFHCTAPVRPSRAQEILYGPTLKPYLYGEQIGRALVEQSKLRPALVFTDTVHVLAVRDFVACPVVCVLEADADRDDREARRLRLDSSHPEPTAPYAIQLRRFAIGDQPVAVPQAHADDESQVRERFQPELVGFDLREPFGRIRDAIDEACRSAR